MTDIRHAPLEITPTEFKLLGYQLVDTIAAFLERLPDGPITPGETPSQVQVHLNNEVLPSQGTAPAELLSRASRLVLEHSLFNGHPKFMGYITGAPAPIGMLSDLLAAAANPNCGANILSPMATAIEKQVIRWLSELIGLDQGYGGILVSGGNMANFTAFLAARTAKAPKSLKENGLLNTPGEMVFYCSKATHTWIEKAAVLFGHGLNALRWIPTDASNRMLVDALSARILEDKQSGKRPFLVVGTAGDVSTGAIDDLISIARICEEHQLWFHVDGAYGAPAAVLPDQDLLLAGLRKADSIALDPHKWLYAPLEVGCTLVKNPQHLMDTYSSHPVYYNFNAGVDEPILNFYEYGFQNSRGFRALKVWMALQQVGREGYVKMIANDVRMARRLYDLAKHHPELEAISTSLSITTLRFVPPGNEKESSYLNRLNESLLNELQRGGEVFLSNAVVSEKYCLRACIVNFRTTEKDIDEIIEIIVREGRKVHDRLGVSA
ncbi:MAG: aspartate aminotransferase family protein [Cyclobacteriaceae bacterium]|nr:aspartate aminotransferase family protein [Cyclobacteriaceae bacterium]